MKVSMARFTAAFAYRAPDIVAGKSTRFTKFIRATIAGTLFARPKVKPRWRAHFKWERPMPELQQLKYDDVETTLNIIREKHRDKAFLYVGGDGLSLIRLLWLLLKKPDLYLDSAPMIIPVQGEWPHGGFHIMHAGWRLYLRLIRWCAKILKRA